MGRGMLSNSLENAGFPVTLKKCHVYIHRCIHTYKPLEVCIHLHTCTCTGVGKSRFMVVHMEKDMQVMIVTVAFLKECHNGTVHLFTNLVSAQIAGLHYLYILVSL